MPDQNSAADEHALMQDINEPLNSLPDESVPSLADSEFPTVLRGYDKFAVDAYVRKTNQLLAELQARSSPQAAVRRALERVGEDVSGILQRAHETAEGITTQSRREAEERLEVARREASQLTAWARARVKELDADTDRIWSERDRIVGDAKGLARQLLELAEEAAAKFPAAEEPPMTAEEPAPAGEGAGDTTETVALHPDTSDGEPADHDEGATAVIELPPDRGAEPEGGGFDATRTQPFTPIPPESLGSSASPAPPRPARAHPFDADADDDTALPGQVQFEQPPDDGS
jgi:hypothetical protein